MPNDTSPVPNDDVWTSPAEPEPEQADEPEGTPVEIPAVDEPLITEYEPEI